MTVQQLIEQGGFTAAALPGKAAPKSAAEAICKTLYSLWEESE